MDNYLIKGFIYFTLNEGSSYLNEWKKEDLKSIADFSDQCKGRLFSVARANLEEYALYREFKAEKIYYCFESGAIIMTRVFDARREDIFDIVGIGNLEGEVKFAPCNIKKGKA